MNVLTNDSLVPFYNNPVLLTTYGVNNQNSAYETNFQSLSNFSNYRYAPDFINFNGNETLLETYDEEGITNALGDDLVGFNIDVFA